MPRSQLSNPKWEHKEVTMKDDILKIYSKYFVAEYDDFTYSKKIAMLNFIEEADEMELLSLFESGEIIEPPFGSMVKSDTTIIGESILLLGEVETMLENGNYLAEDLKNKLKDMLGMETDLKYKIGKAAGKTKEALQKQLADLQDKIPDVKAAIAKGVEKLGKAAEHGKELAAQAPGAIAKGAQTVAKKAAEMGQGGKETIKDIGRGLHSDLGHLGKAGSAVKKGAQAVADYAGVSQSGVLGAGGIAAATAVAAAALTGGIMAYRRFFSKAARACKSAPDRKACLAQYKTKALQAQIAALNAGKAKCAKTKKSDACKAKIDSKIAVIKSKMRGPN